MSGPAMNFQVGDLLDKDRMLSGPMVVYWGQEEAIPRPHKLTLTWPEPRKIKWRWKLRKVKAWKFTIRIQPPPEENLDEWGGRVAAALSIPWAPKSKDGDTAIWMPGGCLARNAPEALGCAANVLDSLQGFTIVAAQIEVEQRKGDD